MGQNDQGAVSEVLTYELAEFEGTVNFSCRDIRVCYVFGTEEDEDETIQI